MENHGTAKVAARLKITGRVQGVFFRARTQEAAQAKGVCGWVRNSSDGSVEALLEGEEQAVVEVVKWCRTGPPSAQVTDVAVSWQPAQGNLKDFRIIY